MKHTAPPYNELSRAILVAVLRSNRLTVPEAASDIDTVIADQRRATPEPEGAPCVCGCGRLARGKNRGLHEVCWRRLRREPDFDQRFPTRGRWPRKEQA